MSSTLRLESSFEKSVCMKILTSSSALIRAGTSADYLIKLNKPKFTFGEDLNENDTI